MTEPNVEIERKYLLSALPPAVAGARSVLLDQGYVPGKVVRERVRRLRGDGDERYVRTVKLGRGLARHEFEEETTREIFEALWSVTAGHRLQKRRYFIPADGLTWEIDEFMDRPLVLAELELPAEDHEVRIPSWLAPYIVREVTHERAYVNSRLAR